MLQDWRASALAEESPGFLKAATLTDGAIINVEGFKGRNVSFQCSHKFAWSNNKYFCKDPCKSTEDILVTVESGRRAQSGRITLVDSGDGSLTVTFSHLQLSDSQIYWCGAERFGFDTYTDVQLMVKKAPETETTVMPDVSSTWTDQNNTTHFTTETGTMRPTELSTAVNFISEEDLKISSGTIMYATVGGVALISLLLLAVCIRKSRKTSKCKIQVSSNIADLSNANKGERTRHNKESPEPLSVSTHQHRQDPPTSEPTAASSIPLRIHENIPLSKRPAGSGCSPTNDYDNNSGVYMNPLPAIKYERTGNGTRGKCITKQETCKNTESSTNSAFSCVSKAPCESTKKEPRSLWFGLDISEINLS
ncbi:CMRF35-like molecule 8 [Archocentrus centrarchus]|uniref:CMRF35-like molecule 8 n=1 Tax=Archocentrus centrarchus TaxID=63155 RepID=UPI0011EA1F2A|nr:CMRF35-like molecule 8 [Archocentrus centrarchus]